MNNEQKIWTRGDVVAGIATGLLAFAVYAWTVAPNVTLLDSGEFTVAAQHFGVPHPTGYPLWTLLAWIFTLLPLGNASWEINLFSSVCAGLTVGLFAALSRSSLRWLMGESLSKWSGLTTAVSVTFGLLYAFSFSMWSQATITEVYALHALATGAYLTSLYVWLRKPDSLGMLLLGFFLLALSFSNHQLTIWMPALSLLAVLLVRRQMFWDLLVASFVTSLLAYFGFAILSGEPLLLKTSLRFAYFVALCFLVLTAVRRLKGMEIELRLIAYLPFVVAFGLLPYAYMPLASSTNPPMNWAYTSTPEGFFFSFNRSQYDSPLSEVSLRSLGRFMGTIPPEATAKKAKGGEGANDQRKSLLARAQEWAGFFWLQLGQSFTLVGILGYFGAIFVLLRLGDVGRRTWIYILEIGFVLAVFLQPIMEGASIDAAGWWQQMPYHTYTNFFFAQLAAVGIAFVAIALFERIPRLAGIRFALFLLPFVPLYVNYDGCSQRDRWFGWQFGHDMLKDLPKGSIVLGGSDPGRFVPTYMILGESGQDRRLKRDPDFDRRDLYIITQNGVGEALYRKYLADQYGPDRPAPKNAFERWLGRADAYPKTPLTFPTAAEIQSAVEIKLNPPPGTPTEPPDRALAHSEATRLIWEKNRDKHDFFVEESFPLTWSYDHAIPHKLVYQINKEPLKEIPAEKVKEDFAFWEAYIKDLLANPNFKKDEQSLILWPGNPESLLPLTKMFWDKSQFDQALALLEPATLSDPNSGFLIHLWAITEKFKEVGSDIQALEAKRKLQPRSRDTTQNLLQLYATVEQTNKAAELLDAAIPLFQDDSDFLRNTTTFAEGCKLQKQQLAAAARLAILEPNNPENQILLARAAFLNNDKKAFYPAAREAVRIGGEPMRDAFEKNAIFAPWQKDPEFKALTSGQIEAPTPTGSSKPAAAGTNTK